ncbi:enoyl-ACP reductase FabI [Conexibacter stalactiti]|uniref:Enoyl-[acyl-carrier-protein] reductase [NADH] n=1 Tax=Conexibacter stalactiti TaxID=1940611 RepID=A0ABU4HVF6_9ACTN|nr:enoyl-ACP reductase FabI [Conexibacter stalactiti]MDW5596525.1 enoyl-ACP reductase FabI [Conexibacter stalactiti]MEC5037167.1 enoyl-ACP reductase FabI [Conexibacter stalactiti]
MQLDGRRYLITGVLTKDSIAFSTAQLLQELGAEVLLTGFGRAKRLTDRVAAKLPREVEVLELDVNNAADYPPLVAHIDERWGRLDGVLHAVAFAPEDALGGNFLQTPVESALTAFQTSAFSLKELGRALRPLLVRSEGGGAIVGLDFDATVAWPIYDWMGVAKAALESTSRYLARDLGPDGIRVNLVSAGPLKTVAAGGIPGFQTLADAWGKQAPLGWDVTDPEPVARTIAFLLSDWASAISGEIVHVDGGFHAMGTAINP